MRKISISTSGDNVRIDENCKNDLKMLKDAGFNGIDLSFSGLCGHNGNPDEYYGSVLSKSIDELRSIYGKYKKYCDEYGISAVQAHAPWPCWFPENDELNAFMKEAVEKCIMLCSDFGCKYLIVHPSLLLRRDAHKTYDVNFKMYSQFVDCAKKYGVGICLENLFLCEGYKLYDEPFSNPDFVKRFIDDLNEKAGEKIFSFCLDIGHANLLSKNFYEFFKTLGDRLTTLHVHGNNGSNDQHSIPFVSVTTWGEACTTDWECFIDSVRDNGYKGDINFEINLEALPRELYPEALAFTAAIGRYFAKRFDEGK